MKRQGWVYGSRSKRVLPPFCFRQTNDIRTIKTAMAERGIKPNVHHVRNMLYASDISCPCVWFALPRGCAHSRPSRH
jgi:hypothetical protein